ncbi:hypothetical protein SQ11_15120 [Nitrosospira sp. NpAV]|nr:hypothetical protein SQ11_15120 [Nitrosospira sp. NpAV]
MEQPEAASGFSCGVYRVRPNQPAENCKYKLRVSVCEKKVGWLARGEAGWLKGYWVGEPNSNG